MKFLIFFLNIYIILGAKCPKNNWHCPKSDQCILITNVCNGYKFDCTNGADEDPKLCKKWDYSVYPTKSLTPTTSLTSTTSFSYDSLFKKTIIKKRNKNYIFIIVIGIQLIIIIVLIIKIYTPLDKDKNYNTIDKIYNSTYLEPTKLNEMYETIPEYESVL